MLKTRVIPCLTMKEERFVKSVQFAEHRNLGSYIGAVRVFNARDVDEMIILDLDGRKSGLNVRLLDDCTRECFMPLTIGGGVRSLEDIKLLLKLGADKISLNTEAFMRPALISEAAEKFGRQCVVVSIDVRRTALGQEVCVDGGERMTGRSAVDWAKEVESLGAGEILLTSIDHDGMMDGFDIALTKNVSDAVRIPVIASGGASSLEDFLEVVRDGRATAVAAASIFQYTQVTPANVKDYLRANAIDTRV